MDFSLTDEQAMLADSIGRYIDDNYDFDARMKIVESDRDFSADHWRAFAEMGWTALPFAEADGGFDGGAIETMLVMEAFGRGLVVEPYLATVVLAGGVLKRAPRGERRDELLAGIIDGSTQVALAFAEPQARFDCLQVATTAERDGDDFLLNGRKNLVLNGGNADVLIVPARSSGNPGDENGITLFAVAADSEGLDLRRYPTVDGHSGADVTLEDLRVSNAAIIGDLDAAGSLLAAAMDEATLAACAEAMGILQAMHEKTVEYTKQRVQFGVPIGSFQALQHRMVDMLMHCEQTRSLLYWAVMLHADGDDAAERAISALKYQVGTAGRRVGEEAVQLHGGMGVTWELDIAHYFKRLVALQQLFGNADFHLDRYAAA
ncbi:MAG: acyl-CoA dehydrogenase family protein [Woeseiaceae bacterium]|nr:acyl-CoA dehydrogenase family protein [Woeseiaceae bacterium]